MPGLSARDLAVGWNGTAAAAGVSFELAGGQVLVIAGPNGVGKSTILKAAARQVRSLSGTITLDGKELWQMPAREFAKKVAYVPQSLELGQSLTVQELVGLGRNPHQQWWSWNASEEDSAAIRRALEKTGTWDLRHKYVSNLSGGERQRTMIATALAQEPQFLLLDEPTSHLDFRHQLELADLVKELRANGLGILVVLHDLNLMARLADSIVMLAKPAQGPGQVTSYGAPQEVLSPDVLRRVYQVDVSILTDPETGMKVYTAKSCS